VSDAGEPDARDWFGGARPAGAARGPRPIAEAFGHLRKVESAEAEDPSSGPDADADAGSDADPAEPVAEPRAATDPVPGLVAALADAASAGDEALAATEPPADEALDTAEGPDTTGAPDAGDAPAAPAPDGRVRLQALTGGLADLSDALAAIGVQSVAVRNNAPVRPATPQPAAPAPAADFRVRCPDCGPQYVAIADVRFVETGDDADTNRYLFTCPACGARVRRPAGPELAEILKSSGVATLALRRGPGQAL
jgi:predicted RNA-binding Zn-ribbon protein involved in translation (DUF1610 family)